MESYDLVMLGILVSAGLFGAYKGFAWQIASLASLIVSYGAAYKFRDVVTPLINTSPPWNTFTAMLIIYSTVSAVIWVGFRVVSDLVDKMRLESFDRQMGAIFGLAKGVLLCTVVTFFAVTLLGEEFRRDIVHSRSGHFIAKLLHQSDPIIPSELKELLGPHLEQLEEQLDGGDNGAEGGGQSGGGVERDAAQQAADWNGASRRTPRR